MADAAGGDDTITAALQYVKYAFKTGSGFAGTVQFQVTDNSSGGSYTKSLQVKAGEEEGVIVHDGDPPAGVPVDCVVKVEKAILLAILTGVLEAPLAFMFGQISADNLPVLTNFINAFEFKKEKFEEFQRSLSKQVEATSDDDKSVECTEVNGDPSDSNVADNTESKQAQPKTASGPSPSVGSPRTRELQQNLAVGGLKLIIAARSMAKEVDAFINRVKENQQLKTAVAQLGDEAVKLQTTEGYQRMQANSAFNSLRVELEKASIGVSSITCKAMDKGFDVVETLAKTAYPTYVPTTIDLSVPLPHNPPPTVISSSPRSLWAHNFSSSSPIPSSTSATPSAPISTSPSAPAATSTSPSASVALPQPAANSSTPSTPPSASPKRSLFQSLRTVVTSPSLPRMLSFVDESKEDREVREKVAKEREREAQEVGREVKEKEAKEKERERETKEKEAKERAKEVKEKEEKQRDEKRRQLQAKLEELQRQNEEAGRQRQEEMRKKKEELEERKKELEEKKKEAAEQAEKQKQTQQLQQQSKEIQQTQTVEEEKREAQEEQSTQKEEQEQSVTRGDGEEGQQGGETEGEESRGGEVVGEEVQASTQGDE